MAEGRIWRNWHLTSFVFGLNHGCVTTPLVFATSLLDERVGYAGSALLYVFTCLGSLFVSVPIVSTLGQRLGLFFGMAMYCVFIGCFTVAAASPSGSWEQWAFFVPGSCAGGIAASALWTAQGGLIDKHATALLECSDEPDFDRQKATASLSSIFAVYYLLTEVLCKLASSFALKLRISTWLTFAVFVVVAVLSAVASLGLRDVAPAAGGVKTGSACAKLTKAVSLWSDPRIWLLSFTNLTFGFAAAFMNGYVNAVYTKVQLGSDWVGFFATATALTGALASYLFGALARRLGTKGPFIFVGSMCFLSIPLLVLLAGLDRWGYWLVVPYLLQGCGRAVYESTSKGVFADFFAGAKAEGAFANSMMQTTLSFAVCFFLSSVLSRTTLTIIVSSLAVLTFPAYLLAARCFTRADGECDGRSPGSAAAAQTPANCPSEESRLSAPLRGRSA